MADIFSVEPPRWLQQATQQKPGQLGKIAGVALGGLINSLQQTDEQVEVTDQSTGEKKMVPANQASWLESRKGLKQGIAEARLNMADPEWKLKAEATKASIYGQVVQNEMQYSKLKESNQELAAWQKAFPAASSWLSATPEQRQTMPVPDTGGSKQLLGAIQKTQQQDEILMYRKSQADAAKQRAENSSAASKIQIKIAEEGIKAVEPLGAEAQARIGPPKGPGQTYNPEQWGMINAEREAAGLPRAGITQKPVAAQSPLGKLQADYAAAVKSNAPQEVLDAYKNAIANANTKPDEYKPKIDEIPGTDMVVVWNQKNGTFSVQHKKTGEEVKLTAKEMMEIADTLDDKDPRKKAIMDRLAGLATGKKGATGQGATTETEKGKGGVKVLSITPKGGEEKKVDSGAPAPAAAPASPQSKASMEFFDSVKAEQKKDNTKPIGNTAIKSLARQLAEKVPIKKDSDLLRIGDSTLYHSPEKAYYNALIDGQFKGISGDKIWEYIMGLPEDEQRKMFQQALKDAKK